MAQVWSSDLFTWGGVETPPVSCQEWATFCSFLPGLLGGLGPPWSAVPHLPVPLRWFPHTGGPQPQRTAGWPGRVCRRAHASEFPQLPVQCTGLAVCLHVLLLLGQRGLYVLQAFLCSTDCCVSARVCCGISNTAPQVPKRGPISQEWRRGIAQRVCYLFFLNLHFLHSLRNSDQ